MLYVTWFCLIQRFSKVTWIVLMCIRGLPEETNLSCQPRILSFSSSNILANSVGSTFKLHPEPEHWPLSSLIWFIARASELLPASTLKAATGSFQNLSQITSLQHPTLATALTARCWLVSHNLLLLLWPTFLQLAPCSLHSNIQTSCCSSNTPGTLCPCYILCRNTPTHSLSLSLEVFPQMSPHQTDHFWPSLSSRDHLPRYLLLYFAFFPLLAVMITGTVLTTECVWFS